jgi:hypothetical protein
MGGKDLNGGGVAIDSYFVSGGSTNKFVKYVLSVISYI